MPWLNYSGRTAAEFPLTVSGGGSVSPHLLQSRSAWDEILKTLAPAIKDYLQQKKADEIANSVLNMENPPRAEAVDPSIQGAPATQPFTGGQQAYKAQKLYQDYLRQQAGDQAQSTNEYWQNKVREAQFNKLQAEADAPDSRVEVELPDGRRIRVTPNEAAQYYKPRVGQQDSIGNIDRDTLAWTGHHLSDLINSKDARNNPDGSATITLADGKTQVVVPADALQSVRDRYAKLRQNTGAGMYQSRLTEPDLPPVTPEQPTTAPAPKQLDPATAKAILAEAGGDKEKARQIARERGYSF